MFSLLVAIVFLAFIGLGLPDSLLGSAWAVIAAELNAPVSAAGILSMTVACSTIVSSLFSNFATNKLGAGLVTALSVLTTAVALFGFSLCTAFWQMCLWAVPYGLGAGAVDAALNNYAALHFSSRHLNWLHCFWGVGASAGPYVMGFCLTNGFSWQNGYQSVGVLQLLLSALLFATLPVWKKQPSGRIKQISSVKTKDALKTKGVWLVCATFFCYCALEQTAILWASTHLVLYKQISKETAAFFATLFCTGMTVGRFACGVFSNKISDKTIVRVGIAVVFAGLVAFALPLDFNFLTLGGLVLTGLGCAPVYPAIIHSTPANFGEENSQAIVGVQMAFAYGGTTFVPLLFGTIAQSGEWALPLCLAAFAVALAVLSEIANSVVAKNHAKEK